MNKALKITLRILSYILVAALAVGVTFWACGGNTKMTQLKALIQQVYVEDVDWQAAEDAACAALVDSLPDGWSFYISASEYESYLADMKNDYVGVGITIQVREDGKGQDILQVEPGSSAQEMGVLPGDMLVQVDGVSTAGMDVSQVAQMIRGEEGGQVQVTVLRDDKTVEITLTRSRFQRQVATGKMLEGNVGYITIVNFHENSAQQTIAVIEDLVAQGAQALVFDVRNNGGGYKDEMVELLDYLLPEGPLFRSVNYLGREEVDNSDAGCLELPMAVLINKRTYSAAEFFAAALEEYDWAVTVGEATIGKGHFQVAYPLGDGSAVSLSVGKYCTPNGVSLADVGGLVPGVPVEVDQETEAMIYSGLLAAEEDPQLQAALEALK